MKSSQRYKVPLTHSTKSAVFKAIVELQKTFGKDPQKALRFIDKKFDPVRTFFNQICRIFSGAISEIIFGAFVAYHFIFPLALSLGLLSNTLNAIFKFKFFHKNRSWDEYWPYLLLTALVAAISSYTMCTYILHGFDTKMLRIGNLPVSILCATIQLTAEFYNFADRNNQVNLHKARLLEQCSEENTQAFTNAVKEYRIKKINILTLSSILVIGWTSNLMKAFFVSMGTLFSLCIASLGLLITFAYYNHKKFPPYSNYITPTTQGYVDIISHNTSTQPKELKAIYEKLDLQSNDKDPQTHYKHKSVQA